VWVAHRPKAQGPKPKAQRPKGPSPKAKGLKPKAQRPKGPRPKAQSPRLKGRKAHRPTAPGCWSAVRSPRPKGPRPKGPRPKAPRPKPKGPKAKAQRPKAQGPRPKAQGPKPREQTDRQTGLYGLQRQTAPGCWSAVCQTQGQNRKKHEKTIKDRKGPKERAGDRGTSRRGRRARGRPRTRPG
jgi:hypothetical protein